MFLSGLEPTTLNCFRHNYFTTGVRNCRDTKSQVFVSKRSVLSLTLPNGPFTILQPRDQEIGEFCEVQDSRTTDVKAPKL